MTFSAQLITLSFWSVLSLLSESARPFGHGKLAIGGTKNYGTVNVVWPDAL